MASSPGQSREEAGPAGTVVRRKVITLDDGHRVGVSAAGRGVPFVLLHGIGLSHTSYERCLSYLPSLGFLAIGIDAPGHGRTEPLASSSDFATRAALLDRTLQALGVRRAVLAGHSMGGRNVACLTAMRPERVIASVFLDAALGHQWDINAVRTVTQRGPLIRGVVEAMVDARRDGRMLTASDRQLYRRSLFGARGLRWSTLRHLPGTAKAVAQESSAGWLREIAAAGTPCVVVHGANDLLVSMNDARSVAAALGAPLIVLPDAYHAWPLAHPQSFLTVMRALVTGSLGHLGRAMSAEPPAACLADGALALSLAGEPRTLDPVPRVQPLRWRLELPPGRSPQ